MRMLAPCLFLVVPPPSWAFICGVVAFSPLQSRSSQRPSLCPPSPSCSCSSIPSRTATSNFKRSADDDWRPLWRRSLLFTATTDPSSVDAGTPTDRKDKDKNEGATTTTTTEVIPFFATPKETAICPPAIPPPQNFDEPVDLAVVVSWVEDIMSKQWGSMEDVKPLFYEMGMGYTQVAICVSEPNKRIYVTFRGTDVMEFPDIFANVDIRMEEFGPPPDQINPKNVSMPGKVQRGWNRKIFNPSLYLELSDKLLQTKEDYPEYQVIIAGHSLGAALSILYGVYVAKYVLPGDDNPIQVMNLGSPRVGNEEFYNAIQQISNLSIWRLVYLDDIVPRYPPMWMGYRHVGHMMHWDWDGRVKAYHQQLESCMDSGCYVGVEPEKRNFIGGKIKHHKHDNYKLIISKALKHPDKYWPKEFETF